jgi:histidinol-phosphate aminotransferase
MRQPVAAHRTRHDALPQQAGLDRRGMRAEFHQQEIRLRRPHAPAALARFLAAIPEHVVVVVDEAYAEIADAPDYASALSLLPRHPNLVVTRTFSKAYALAGLRVGYAIASAGVAGVLERVRESFNVNAVALAAAEAALADDEHLRTTSAENARQRERLATALRERGWRVGPSQANFLRVEFGAHTAAVEAGLLRQGVVPRPMGGYGLPHCLRISVGDAVGNRRFLAALDALALAPGGDADAGA